MGEEVGGSTRCRYLRPSPRTLADSLTIIKCKGPIGSLLMAKKAAKLNQKNVELHLGIFRD
jgi:hypothetical protein